MYPSRFVEFFGPSTWRFLHSVAFTYPEKPDASTRKAYIDFFRSVGNVLPCPSCGNHYNEYITKHPIMADSTESLARWVYELHDNVNSRREAYGNGKIYRPSYDEVKKIYTGYSPDENSDLDPVERLKILGDPFNGKDPSVSHASEAMSKMGASSGNRNVIFMLIILVLIGAAALFVQQRQRNRENKK